MQPVMDILRKEIIVGVMCWELKSHLLKALVLPTCTFDTKIWESDLKNSHWKAFKKGMKMHVMSHVEVHSSTTYHKTSVEFGELPIELYVVKFTMGFQQWLAHLLSS